MFSGSGIHRAAARLHVEADAEHFAELLAELPASSS
jgi:hypothetical protein